LGRPRVEEEYSLKHILKTTSDVLGKPVQFVSDCIVEAKQNAAAKLQAGEVICLRFLKRKIKMLKKLSNIHVNDAFRTAHRAHFNYNHYCIFQQEMFWIIIG
jgi:phosphoglycerate kinase